jgi:UDP-GlcNAc:undecaprenyl-phosphate/decaprenyl-phosphate GlcNAc-1-phosphate transferase
VPVQLSALLIMGAYRGVWSYTSTRDLVVLLRAVVVAWLCSLVALVALYRLEGISRSALAIDLLLLLLGMFGTRGLFRASRSLLSRSNEQPSIPLRKALIYGAGDGGELLARELLRNNALGYLPVGFVDDDSKKHGRSIQGLPIVGDLSNAEQFLQTHDVNFILLSTSKLSAESTRRLRELCKARPLTALELQVALKEVSA